MHLNREMLLTLWNLEDMPACHARMSLVEAFLVSCGEAIGRFRKEDPDGRIVEITAGYMAIVDHSNICDDCNKAVAPGYKEVNERPEKTMSDPSSN